jgi:hypothetical protein
MKIGEIYYGILDKDKNLISAGNSKTNGLYTSRGRAASYMNTLVKRGQTTRAFIDKILIERTEPSYSSITKYRERWETQVEFGLSLRVVKVKVVEVE